MQEKVDLLNKYKLWAQAKDKGEITTGDKPNKRTRQTREKSERNRKKDELSKKDETGASAEDADDGKKKRTAKGERKNRRESPKTSEATPKSEEKPDVKTESKPGLTLDDQMGLQDIGVGLRVGADGGYAVVDSHETVEDDSGFTTVVGEKEKKAQLREEAQQKEKVARKQRAQEAKTKEKEAKAKAKAEAKTSSTEKKTAALPEYPSPISTQDAPLPQPQDPAAQSPAAAPAKPAWGGSKPASNEKANFTSIMLDQKFKQTFPEQRIAFEAPAPKDPLHPAPTGSAPVGAGRKFPGSASSDHDIWANNSAPPVASSAPFSTIPFDTGVGGGGFGSNFNGAAPGAPGSQAYAGSFENLRMHTLTPQIAQFTALPSFAGSDRYNHAFSAAPGGDLDGWGSTVADPTPQQFGQQNGQAEVPVAGWSDQKAVGSRSDPNAKPNSGKGSGDKFNKKSRGGKGRGKGKGGKDNVSAAPKAKENASAKPDSGKGKGSRQNRGGKNQASNTGGKQPVAKQPVAKPAADKASAPVDAVIPAKSGIRRGGRNAKKGNNPPASDKN